MLKKSERLHSELHSNIQLSSPVQLLKACAVVHPIYTHVHVSNIQTYKYQYKYEIILAAFSAIKF